ncbi:MAG: hypothetical protein K9L56_15725 [Clostridiales bacterium]|nr:hypothetical protein [Clostridiales bacterium]
MASRGTFFVLAVFFRLSLEFGYRVYVHPIHGYSGFPWEPSIIKYIESWLILGFLVAFAPSKLSKPSDFFINVLLFGLMIPLLSFYNLADQSRQHLYIVILGYALVDVFRSGRSFRFPVLREGRIIAFLFVGAGVVGVSTWFVASGGISFFNLDLTEVYQYRRSASAVIHAGPMGYINTWAWKVFGPALLAIALWKKKYWMAIFVIGIHVFWFGVSAHKSVLFYPLLVVCIWFWFTRSNALGIVPLGSMIVVLLSLLIFYLADYNLPASLFVRRVFYVIANNTFDYYEFFSNNPLVWWSNSSVSLGLLDYPYDIGAAELIGKWRGSGGHINNTFLSTGYMHAGVLGIFMYGILAGLLFRLIDSFATKGVPVWVVLAVLVVPSRSMLLSADLPTSLLTHGIGVGIIILFLVRKSAANRHLHADAPVR